MVYIPAYAKSAPIVDVSKITGNASDELKQFVWGMYKFVISSSKHAVFGDSIGDRIRCVSMNVWDDEGNAVLNITNSGPPGVEVVRKPAKAETVFEVEVTRDMCNIFGILHGACAAFLMDSCSVTSFGALGAAQGIDGMGLSQSMNITFIDAAPLGTTLRIVNTSMMIKGLIRAGRSELWNGKKLCVSSVNTVINATTQMEKTLARSQANPDGRKTPSSKISKSAAKL